MVYLFHGPQAKKAAEKAALPFRLVATFEGALKVAEARELSSLLLTPSLGTKKGAVLVGPLDESTPEASDVLLKPLEEASSLEVFLWALDVGAVRPTIVSRSRLRWSPGEIETDEDVEEIARVTVSSLTGRRWELPDLIFKIKGKEKLFLRSVSDFLQSDISLLPLWGSLRALFQHRNPTYVEILAAFAGVPE